MSSGKIDPQVGQKYDLLNSTKQKLRNFKDRMA